MAKLAMYRPLDERDLNDEFRPRPVRTHHAAGRRLS